MIWAFSSYVHDSYDSLLGLAHTVATWVVFPVALVMSITPATT